VRTDQALGTQLRHLLELMDDDVAAALTDLGLPHYRPRYSPVVAALLAHGPSPIRDLARAIGVTHSAASQTVAQMHRAGLVRLAPGADARHRIVHLTPAARRALPAIRAEWAATAAAADALDAELPVPLRDLLAALRRALERRGFRQRIADAAGTLDDPDVAAHREALRHGR
jgi:DNA-binding MarR family transcriptional regulator